MSGTSKRWLRFKKPFVAVQSQRAVGTGDETEKTGLKPIPIHWQAQTGLNLCATLIALHPLYFYTDRPGLSSIVGGRAVRSNNSAPRGRAHPT